MIRLEPRALVLSRRADSKTFLTSSAVQILGICWVSVSNLGQSALWKRAVVERCTVT